MAKKKKSSTNLEGENRLTSDCVNCKYGKLTENKKILCKNSGKFYMYGQRIMCGNYEEVK